MEKSYEELMILVGKTAEIANSNTENTAVVLAELQSQRSLLNGLSNTVAGIDGRLNTLGTELDQLKLNEEITTTQQEVILETARKRVLEIIGNDPLEIQKYSKMFFQNLYKDTRHYTGLAPKISRTKKRDYQRCIDYIEAWIPSCGCAALRAKADANAKARIEAKKLGYVS
jgi:hypothetical protein